MPPTCRLFVVLLLCCGPTTAQSERSSLWLGKQQEKHARHQQEFEREIDMIVDWCNERGLVDLAKRTRAENMLPDPAALTEVRLSQLVAPEIPAAAIDDERTWHVKINRARGEHAKSLYSLSREALRQRHVSYSMSLIREVVYHHPDHKLARQVLGFRKYVDRSRKDEPDYAGEWLTAYEREKRRNKEIWTDEFGWIKERDLTRYQSGERKWRGSWITAEKAAEIHRNFSTPWEIETEHFYVKTNHSFERGVEIARKLEQYHGFFHRMFASFFETPEQLMERFKTVSRNNGRFSPPRQLKVHYYRNKRDYVDALKDKIPPIEKTNGLYYEPTQTCYFFNQPAGDEAERAALDDTLFHEATHQFLDIPTLRDRAAAANARANRLRRPPTRWIVGEKRNFWVVEGIACYMESFRITEQGYSLGDPYHSRPQSARVRMTDPRYRFFLPMRRFVALGMQEFQSSRELSQRYTQGAGIAHFLMHYDGGRYRDGFMQHLAELYRPDVKDPLTEPSLEEALGVSFAELDQQYTEYISNLYKPTSD